jgi:2'-5' RNA ligase
MPRLFTGLEIPADLATELSMLRGGLSGARWIDTANFHLTLRFIGDIDSRTAGDVASVLEKVRFKPFKVMLDEVATFGGERPRAIVVKAKSVPALMDLQAEQERLMRRIGIPPEARKFTPHVTLARLRGASPIAVAGYLAMQGAFFARSFEASRFVLYSSRASTGGGPYIVEAAYPLSKAET